MSQSHLETSIEVLTNTWLGFIGSWLIAWSVFKWMPGTPSYLATVVTLLCTAWSIVRGYTLRRYFNRRHNGR